MPRRGVNATRKRLQNETLLREVVDRSGHYNRLANRMSDHWAPNSIIAFHVLLLCRLAAALWSPISDCDEVYNYWEPLHFLLNGNGFQTWEYSPDYAIRSYAYIGLHYIPAWLVTLFTRDGKTVFMVVRIFLSFVCASSDAVLYSSVCQKFGTGVGRWTLVFQAVGAGYFISTSAFLPSSFAMALTSFAFGFWLSGRDWAAVLSIAISALVGWPFAALLGVPIAIDMLFIPPYDASAPRRKRTKAPARRKPFVVYSVVSGAALGALLFVTDSAFFGKPTLAPFNIIRYNIFTQHGPDLYGVAPLSYYILNLFLNWNFAAVLACTTIPLTILAHLRISGGSPGRAQLQQLTNVLLIQLGYWLWLLVFFWQPHKEERFLYPVYPLLCLSAALALDSYEVLCRSFVRIIQQRCWRFILIDAPLFIFLILFTALSIARSVGQYRNFHGPLDVYGGLSDHAAGSTDGDVVNVCVGKEWYRYPSSFFLPNNSQLQFLKSEFAGLLPKPFPRVSAGDWRAVLDATRSVPTDMNGMNKEEPSRYVQLSECDYLVDLDTGETSTLEPNYSADTETWTVVKSSSFLISDKSNTFYRAFYVPVLSDRNCVFGRYNLLKRKKPGK